MHDVKAIFNAADTNGDGIMSLEEYLQYMGVNGTDDIWVDYYKK